MTTADILRKDKKTLRQVNEAIRSLAFDKRTKSQVLRGKFIELREDLMISIASNERALRLEKKYAKEARETEIMFVI